MFLNCKFILFTILCVISYILGESCNDGPVLLNEEFLMCCKGRPLVSSEQCVDTLLENSTFSRECLLDCMFKEFKIYNGQTLNMTAVRKFVDKKITNPEFKVLYQKAYERCNKLEKSEVKKTFKYVKISNQYGCDVYPTYMDVCVWYYTVANCPALQANNDSACSKKRKWVKECLLKD